MLLYLHLIRIFKFFMASALKHIINEILYRLTSLEFFFNIIPGIAFNVTISIFLIICYLESRKPVLIF